VRRRREEQEGQVAALLLLLVVSVAGAGLMLLALAEASDVRGKAQKAADAGALAASVGARNLLVQRMRSNDGASFSSWQAWDGYALAGCSAAYPYAQANSGSQALSCLYRAGRARVDTRSAESSQRGLRGTATATADLNAPGCSIEDTATKDTVIRTITCRNAVTGVSARAVFDLGAGTIIGADSETRWQQTFRVRLVE
jgi:hypothetical protein